MSGYDLHRDWFDFQFENTSMVTPSHGMLYLWLCEINNRMGWVKEFQITAKECMQGMSCHSYNTYKKCLDELIVWGFVDLKKKSQNQWQTNVIALSKNDKSLDKSLDKSVRKHSTNHSTNHSEITVQTTGDILKPLNLKPINLKTKKEYAPLVHMLESEFHILVQKHGEDKTIWMVEALDNYKGSSGKKYKDDYRAVLSWVIKKADLEFKSKNNQKSGVIPKPSHYTNPKAYYETCVERKVVPVQYATEKTLTSQEIAAEHLKFNVGIYA